MDPAVLADPYGRLLVALLAVAAIVLVGRVVLAIAWRLLVLAALVVAALYVGSLLGVV